jgi:hypothetical protein
MKKYKLIKEYPGSPKLGCVTALSFNKHSQYPEFWEEVVEKDYEILSFKDIGKSPLKGLAVIQKDGTYSMDISYPMYSSTKGGLLTDFLNLNTWVIHSVKRLSDGEVFTVGDKYNDCNLKNETIIEFQLGNNGLLVNTSLLKNVQHIKKPLFTTEDGVNIFKDDRYWVVAKNNIKYIGYVISAFEIEKNDTSFKEYNWFNYWSFSTEKAAKQYVLMNKPCLSIKDVSTVFFGDFNGGYVRGLKREFRGLKELVEGKKNV